MKILLFNDNPVVRKLVALSAQKTKDDLSVVWSMDEIEEGKYDLLIIDDALYSVEIFESLDEKIGAKCKLLMATRGNEIPQGFDHVINKPFLPTDLVDMFVQIQKKVVTTSNVKEDEADELSHTTSVYSINLEDTLPDIECHEDGSLNMDTLESVEDDFDFGSLDDFDEKLPETAILDHEEVQEVQGLLDDTDEEGLEDNSLAQSIEDLVLPEEDELKDEISKEDAFGEDLIPEEIQEEILNFDDILEDEIMKIEEEIPNKDLLDEDAFADIEFPSSFEECTSLEEEELLPLNEDVGLDEVADIDENGLDELDIASLIDDEPLNHLEANVEDEVSGLGSEELDRELVSNDFGLDFEDDLMEELDVTKEEVPVVEMNHLSGFDELDMLDERELKRAVGEEVEEDESEALVGDEEIETNINDEEELVITKDVIEESNIHESAPKAQGVEALQVLLKALSNEDVAASLKGMNISININFGNEK
jgi:uncharacterized membrane protein